MSIADSARIVSWDPERRDEREREDERTGGRTDDVRRVDGARAPPPEAHEEGERRPHGRGGRPEHDRDRDEPHDPAMPGTCCQAQPSSRSMIANAGRSARPQRPIAISSAP
jgi:hypothetical protein